MEDSKKVLALTRVILCLVLPGGVICLASECSDGGK